MGRRYDAPDARRSREVARHGDDVHEGLTNLPWETSRHAEDGLDVPGA
jgi:hypothetical protein